MTVESLELRRVYGTFPTGVIAIAAVDPDDPAGRPLGLAASSFTSVSLDPPLVSVCVAHTSTTWPVLRRHARLGVSVLGAHQEQTGRQLAARVEDRFAGLDWVPGRDGAVFISGASAWFECSIDQQVRAGDHDIVVLAVHDVSADHTIAPLVFHASRYRRLDNRPPDASRPSAQESRLPR